MLGLGERRGGMTNDQRALRPGNQKTALVAPRFGTFSKAWKLGRAEKDFAARRHRSPPIPKRGIRPPGVSWSAVLRTDQIAPDFVAQVRRR